MAEMEDFDDDFDLDDEEDTLLDKAKEFFNREILQVQRIMTLICVPQGRGGGQLAKTVCRRRMLSPSWPRNRERS